MQFLTMLAAVSCATFLVLGIGTICRRCHLSEADFYDTCENTVAENILKYVQEDTAIGLVVSLMLFVCSVFSGMCAVLFYLVSISGLL